MKTKENSNYLGFVWYGEWINGTHEKCREQMRFLASNDDAIDEDELNDGLLFVRDCELFGIDEAVKIREKNIREKANIELEDLLRHYPKPRPYSFRTRVVLVSFLLMAVGAILVAIGVGWSVVQSLF